MKKCATIAAAATLWILPGLSLADTSNPPPSFPHDSALVQIMQRAHAQAEQVEVQARAAMLNALSPAHRNLVGQIAGQLAVVPNPDLSAAARELDAQLTPAEGLAILNIASSMHGQIRQIMSAARQQIMSAGGASGSGTGPAPFAGGRHAPRFGNRLGAGSRRNDPGFILLVTALRAAMRFSHDEMGVGAPH
jgi:hypothetical protein